MLVAQLYVESVFICLLLLSFWTILLYLWYLTISHFNDQFVSVSRQVLSMELCCWLWWLGLWRTLPTEFSTPAGCSQVHFLFPFLMNR